MEEILAQRLPSFYRTAYRLLGNGADAEVRHRTLFCLLTSVSTNSEGSVRYRLQSSTWLTAIVSNSARMHLRNRPRHNHVSLDEPIVEGRAHSLSGLLPDVKPSPQDRCQKPNSRRS